MRSAGGSWEAHRWGYFYSVSPIGLAAPHGLGPHVGSHVSRRRPAIRPADMSCGHLESSSRTSTCKKMFIKS